jgi:hypothetical protein
MELMLERILNFIIYSAVIVTAGCMVYVVMWLEALRKGWLV